MERTWLLSLILQPGCGNSRRTRRILTHASSWARKSFTVVDSRLRTWKVYSPFGLNFKWSGYTLPAVAVNRTGKTVGGKKGALAFVKCHPLTLATCACGHTSGMGRACPAIPKWTRSANGTSLFYIIHEHRFHWLRAHSLRIYAWRHRK